MADAASGRVVATDGTPEPGGLVDALVQVAFATMAVLTKAGADHDLSLTQIRMLGILRDRQLRMTALAAYLGLEKSTISGLAERAERRGLLLRAPSRKDGRAVDIMLSPAGIELARLVELEVQHALAPLTGQLTPAEQRRLQVLLARMLRPMS